MLRVEDEQQTTVACADGRRRARHRRRPGRRRDVIPHRRLRQCPCLGSGAWPLPRRQRRPGPVMAMKAFASIFTALALLVLPTIADAGQIYGTIVLGGQGVKGAPIEIQCGKEAAVTGTTAGDGSYRINVSQQGQCTLTLTSYDGRPFAAVFSGPNPTVYK